MSLEIFITSVKFTNYKAFANYSVSFREINIMVGPNNSGKSTVISAFRILEIGLRIAGSKRAILVPSYLGTQTYGHYIPEKSLPITLENIHNDYSNEASKIEFRFSNKNRIILFFPADGGCILNWDTTGARIETPSSFKKEFPFKIQVVPVLGPLEQEEKIVADETIRRSFGTPRASRHFRNYWYKNPEGFDDFKDMLEKTWPGMSILLPEHTSIIEQRLVMFCLESRQTREVFWAGFGFQIWCQLLTYLFRAHKYNLTVIDEPEVYLHPDVQRQLLGILRELNVEVIFATHSTEILGEADPSEILLIDKKKRSARRLRDIAGIQQALNIIGSVQNITLTQLARNKKILFVEGLNDYKIIRRFAKNIVLQELSLGSDITALESGGFSSWEKVKSLAWGLKKTLEADISIGAIYDRDFWCDDEIVEILYDLKSHLHFAHIHERKEIENYLLVPVVLDRTLERLISERNRKRDENIVLDESIEDILESLSANNKIDIQSQYLEKFSHYKKLKSPSIDGSTLNMQALKSFEKKWNNIEERMKLIRGKQTLQDLRSYISAKWSVTLTATRIIDNFKKSEIPQDMIKLIMEMEKYRTQ